MPGQRLEPAGELVAPGVERQPDRAVLELGAERLAVEVARPLVEQARDHVGEAFLAYRIERRAAAEVQRERQERDRRLAQQVGLDAARADHPLDLGGGLGGGDRIEGAERHREAHQTGPERPPNHRRPARRR
jgi:hypothetical protein